MRDTRMLIACLIAALTTAIAIAILRRFAEPLGLVDRPNERKHHVGHVPLIGGLAVYTGVLAGALWYGGLGHFGQILLGSSAVLALLGALDDRHDLSVRVRLLVQTITILTVIATTGVYIHSLGHIFGYELELGWIGIPFTVIAVIGLLNAFNMMDGIDGLAGSLTLVSIAAIVLFDGHQELHRGIFLIALLATALLPYLAVNLGLTRRKIFMGDAGSMVVGYLIAWTLIKLSQTGESGLTPINVLWCIALPVLDTLAVMYRRIRQGKSPFKPDRGHIHHILMNAGLGPRRTLIALIALASTLAFVGMLTRLLATGSNLMAFCIVAIGYVVTVNRLWHRQLKKKKAFVDFARTAANDDQMPQLLITRRMDTPSSSDI